MRIIAHLDMDAFFASIAERDEPRFKDKPIVVGADPLDGQGRGVVSTANYKARKFGIHSAMPISQAWQLAKQAEQRGETKTIFLGTNFAKYEKASQQIRKIAANFASKIEIASIDELYLDLSYCRSFKKAATLTQVLQKQIKQEQKLSCSLGLAPNKLLAKIASDFKKPGGLTIVYPAQAQEFLDPLPVRKIPGIGPKSETLLKNLNIQTVRDLRQVSAQKMVDLFGKWGEDLYKKARGLDESPVAQDEEVKSIGDQQTLEQDSLDPEILIPLVQSLTQKVFQRFQASSFESFKTIVLTVRLKGFVTYSRSQTLKEPAKDYASLYFAGLNMFLPFLDRRENPKLIPVRLLGIRIEQLS